MTTDHGFRWIALPELRMRSRMYWQEYEPDVLPLWVGEMGCEPAPAVISAVWDVINRGTASYAGETVYAEAFQAFASERRGWNGVDVGRSRLVPGAVQGVVEVLKLVTGPGDAVVVTPPMHGAYFTAVTETDRRIIETPLDARGRLDPDALAAAFAHARTISRTPAFLLCNPLSPPGTVHTRAELEQVAVLAREHGVRIVADEGHALLVLPGATFTPILSVAGMENAFAVTSAGNAFNLVGHEAAVAFAGPESAQNLTRMPGEVGEGTSREAVQLHVAALRHGTGWLDEMLGALDLNRGLLADLVARYLPDFGLYPPQGGFLAWLDCRELQLPAADDDPRLDLVAGPARFFLEHARVALAAGETYGTAGMGHVALNFGASTAVLEEAVVAMGEAVRGR